MKQSSIGGAPGSEDLDDVLDDFGRHPGVAKRIMYGILAMMVSIVPAILFVRVFVIDVSKAQVTLGAGIVISSVILSLSYHNLTFSQSARIRSISSAPSKNSFKGKMEHYQGAVAKYDRSVTLAAFAYSFAYNNAIFLISAPFCASYVFADKVSGELNALCSGAAAAGLALFNSRSALKAIGE